MTKPKVQIRPVRASDLSQVARLYAQALRPEHDLVGMDEAATLRQVRAFSRGGLMLAQLTGRLTGLSFAGWVAVRADQVVGLAGLYGDRNVVEIDPLIVGPEHRGQGIGMALLGRILDSVKRLKSRRMITACLSQPHTARSIWRTAGFSFGVEEGVYELGLGSDPAPGDRPKPVRHPTRADVAALAAQEARFPPLAALGPGIETYYRLSHLARFTHLVYNLFANGQWAAGVIGDNGAVQAGYVLFSRRTHRKSQILRYTDVSESTFPGLDDVVAAARHWSLQRNKTHLQLRWPSVYGDLPRSPLLNGAQLVGHRHYWTIAYP